MALCHMVKINHGSVDRVKGKGTICALVNRKE